MVVGPFCFIFLPILILYNLKCARQQRSRTPRFCHASRFFHFRAAPGERRAKVQSFAAAARADMAPPPGAERAASEAAPLAVEGATARERSSDSACTTNMLDLDGCCDAAPGAAAQGTLPGKRSSRDGESLQIQDVGAAPIAPHPVGGVPADAGGLGGTTVRAGPNRHFCGALGFSPQGARATICTELLVTALSPMQDLRGLYDLRTLCVGKSSRVYAAKDETGAPVALKCYYKGKLTEDQLEKVRIPWESL